MVGQFTMRVHRADDRDDMISQVMYIKTPNIMRIF